MSREKHQRKISIIAAIASGNRALGKNNTLLWRIPDDLKRFKALTMGHPIIMGRKTFDSIGKALPGRTNIIATRNCELNVDGCLMADSLEDALGKAEREEGGEEIFIIGGGELYSQALPIANRLYLTVVDDNKEADVFFPDYSDFKNIISEEFREFGGIKYKWVTLER